MYLLTLLSHCHSYHLVLASKRFQMWEINEMHSTEHYVEKSDSRPRELILTPHL